MDRQRAATGRLCGQWPFRPRLLRRTGSRLLAALCLGDLVARGPRPAILWWALWGVAADLRVRRRSAASEGHEAAALAAPQVKRSPKQGHVRSGLYQCERKADSVGRSAGEAAEQLKKGPSHPSGSKPW